MAVPILPADLQNPWGQVLRDALTDISNRADQGISDAADVGGDLDDLEDVVTGHTATLGTNNTRITTLETSNATKAADNAVVKLSGNQTVAGTKTFSTAPVVPDNSFSISKVNTLQTALNAKAPLANPTFTGTVSGIEKGMVGLTLVDNTADSSKPVSAPQQAALDLKASISDMNAAIQTHNHTGGANGVAIPLAGVSGLSAALGAKQDQIISASATAASTTINTAEFSIDYMAFRRWGCVVSVSIACTTKFGIGNNAGGSGNISNHIIASINSNSTLYDIFQGPGNTHYDSMVYPLSSGADGALASGFINSGTRQIVLAATVPYNFNPGYTFSLGGTFLLNTAS